MKKTGIYNSIISSEIAKMGHTDILTIVDMGYPIPKESKYVDIVLDKGKPSFKEVLQIVLKELEIEQVIIASEIKEKNKEQYEYITKNIKTTIKELTHEEFKKHAKDSRFFIRTGEASPYSNIMLISGVIF
ncbi:MAG: D-ribose pyranase [Oceanotoga sp.]|jgi:D-ribose pyranase|uniref:D-ribose pyranase n=1 Tax=Oceanotoga teriensis TaxID=515440 RepID=A0AA45HIV4_9BACT|nr:MULTISPECIES: D-ribose pyranase [Oceanotoga]MDN5341416.1 D-ribose pyranase [Oceanotoga sp.]PWJ95124.1 D-ribose pyranase [Oceanotoga teriensis]